jgi:hypothetical protein
MLSVPLAVLWTVKGEVMPPRVLLASPTLIVLTGAVLTVVLTEVVWTLTVLPTDDVWIARLVRPVAGVGLSRVVELGAADSATKVTAVLLAKSIGEGPRLMELLAAWISVVLQPAGQSTLTTGARCG